VLEGLRSLASVEERLEFVDRVVRKRKERRDAEFKSNVASKVESRGVQKRNEADTFASH
jgi:hypothetical protein